MSLSPTFIRASFFGMIWIAFTCSAIGQEPNHRFSEESVNLKIEGEMLIVSGMYFIVGEVGEKAVITLALPSGTGFGELDSLHIFDVLKDQPLEPASLNRKEMKFELSFNSQQELVQVFYRIQLLGTRVEYPINHITQGKEPLKKACYILFSPESRNPRKFSYAPTESIDAGANKFFYWEMYDFYPEENFEFRFTGLN